MSMRRLIDLMEGKLTEANWNLSYKYAYRSWYHPETNTFLTVSGWGMHHSKYVAENPEKFGLTSDQVAGADPEVRDRDATIMDLACANGWIRIAGQDRNNPDKFMIFEGTDPDALFKAVRLFYNDQQGALQNVSVKVRSGDGHGGVEYSMRGSEAVTAYVKRRELPEPHHFDASGGLAAA